MQSTPPALGATLLCFSHLRWDFVYQRPQHLMSRLARRHPVLYIEEPAPTEGEPRFELREVAPGVQVAVPLLPPDECVPGHPRGEVRQRLLLDGLLARLKVEAPLLWYYTPMSLGFSDHLEASVVVYDCMDELSQFLHAPPALVPRERALIARADVVFTGGVSLYRAKRTLHRHVHAFPSSVDAAHFAQARTLPDDRPEQAALPHPRIGFYGVLDERLDTALLAAAARRRPDWQWLLVGPVVKIDPATLPQGPNLHYLGPRRYDELPAYLAGWDVAMMPFALNNATRFISPTKTPEYLAGGRPVVSTPITDVVRTWGRSGLVHIGDDAEAFIAAIDKALAGPRGAPFCAQADALLKPLSWDRTVAEMQVLIDERLAARSSLDTASPTARPVARAPLPTVAPGVA
jgi:UDP-galactopyranose mutase